MFQRAAKPSRLALAALGFDGLIVCGWRRWSHYWPIAAAIARQIGSGRPGGARPSLSSAQKHSLHRSGLRGEGRGRGGGDAELAALGFGGFFVIGARWRKRWSGCLLRPLALPPLSASNRPQKLTKKAIYSYTDRRAQRSRACAAGLPDKMPVELSFLKGGSRFCACCRRTSVFEGSGCRNTSQCFRSDGDLPRPSIESLKNGMRKP